MIETNHQKIVRASVCPLERWIEKISQELSLLYKHMQVDSFEDLGTKYPLHSQVFSMREGLPVEMSTPRPSLYFD